MLCCEQEEEKTGHHFSFSLQILTQEGFSVKGEMQMEAIHIPARASRHSSEPDTTYDDVGADVRIPASAVRLNRQTQALLKPAKTKAKQYRLKGMWRGIFWTIFFALLLFFVADTFGASVLQRFQYGDYPTTQMEVNLGHGEMSHLTAYTYQDKIILIESVGNKSTPYTLILSEKIDGPRLVSITIADVNFDHRPDVLLHVDGLTQSIIFDNTVTGLVLAVAR